MADAEHIPVVVVGAGFAGVAMAVRLREAGITDFAVLERANSLGGTWRDNTYPGCACDVASNLYSFSFAPNPAWTRFFSRQPEILSYLEGVAAEHDFDRFARYGVELLAATWDEQESVWRIETSNGPLTAGVLVSATGLFGDPQVPDVPGLDRFEGPAFHSVNWPDGHDLAGRRVAVLGTGPSAIQFVPAIQPDVDHMTVFQRTPPWILPRFDRPTSRLERRLMKCLPSLQRLSRFTIYLITETLGLVIFVSKRFGWMYHAVARWHLRRQVADPQLRARLEPDYVIGCKRAILSDDWFPALTAANVDVVSGSVREVREHSVIADDGSEHEADTIIFGTGFDVPQRGTRRITGRDGRSAADVYAERPQSYKGICLTGFPNFFLFLGAFSIVGNQSAIYVIEAQTRYIVDAIRTMRARGAKTVEVRPERQEEFVRAAARRSVGTVWLEGGCRSYYQTPDGRNNGLWPDWSFRYAATTERFDPEAYVLEPAA
jgi:cation diffusion facilitator CzcD-associated flavoprotein CzcO